MQRSLITAKTLPIRVRDAPDLIREGLVLSNKIKSQRWTLEYDMLIAILLGVVSPALNRGTILPSSCLKDC